MYIIPNNNFSTYTITGVILMHGTTINAGAIVEDNSIPHAKSIIEHDVNIGNISHISTGARIGGEVYMG